MRPVELVTPVLPERPLVVHALLGPVDSRPYFAGLVEAEHREVDAAGLAAAAAPLAPAESLFVVVVDDDIDLAAVLGALDEGAHAALLFKVSPQDLPWARVLQACSVRDLQVVRVAALSYDAIRAGVVVTRSAALRLPATADLAWSEQRNAPVSDATLRRLLNEFVILDLDHRFGAEHRRELEHELRAARAALGPTPVNEQLAELRVQLEAADERRRSAEKRAKVADAAALRDRKQLVAVENSAKYVVGGAIVTIFTRPQRIVRVAKDLRRWWRRRKSGTYLAQAKAAAAAVETVVESAPAVVTDPRTGWGGVAASRTDGPVVLAVLSDEGRATFAHDCDLRVATPTADIAALFGELPDLVLVQASAGRPGELWAGAGRAGEVERTRQVCALLDAAREANVPAVVWRDTETGELPGWASIATRAERAVAEQPVDVEAPWHPGGSLLRARRARLAAIAHGTAPTPVLRVTGADSDPDALARALATVEVAVLESTATQAQAVTAFLSGAGLVAAPGAVVPTALAPYVSVAPSADELDATVDAALARGRYSAAQVAEVVASLRGELSTRARLEGLAAADPGTSVAGAHAPFAVLAHLTGADEATRLAAAVVGANVRPAQLVVAVDDAAADAVTATRALDEIAAAGVSVRRSPERAWAELARRAEWDRVLPWQAASADGVVDALVVACDSSGAAVVAVPRAGEGHDVLTQRSLLIAGPLPADPVGAWRWAGVHVDVVDDITDGGTA